jgi:very-short-patch-repair endonuclease
MKRSLTGLARLLRANQTDAEQRLWGYLKGRRLFGLKFRRQFQIERFVVDFVCLEAQLIVELDGGHHSEQESEDERRTAHLQKLGYQVLRFWNNDALRDIEAVLACIEAALPPHLSPLPDGERK